MIKKALDKIGREAVERYRQSMIDNDRVSTGATLESIEYSITNVNGNIKLLVVGREDINTLETGVSAEEYRSDKATLGALDTWLSAEGLIQSEESLDSKLSATGWNTKLPNRTGENGGTKGIISGPTEELVKDLDDIDQAVKDSIIKQMNIE